MVSLGHPSLLGSLALNGAMVIRNVLPKGLEKWIDAYDKALTSEFGLYPKDICFENAKKGGIPTLLHGLERSEPLTTLFMSSSLNSILSELFSNQLFVLGTDLSTFAGGSIFHRDINSHLPVFKMLLYLNDAFTENNMFVFFPGSHFNTQDYSRKLWEMVNGRSRPMGIDGSKSIGIIDWHGKNAQPLLPWASIQIQPGDVIIFDQRIIHGFIGEQKLRRLVALSFAPDSSLLDSLGITKSFPREFELAAQDLQKFEFIKSIEKVNMYYLFLNTGMLMMNEQDGQKWHIADHTKLHHSYLTAFSGRNIWELLTQDRYELIREKFYKSNPQKAHSIVFSRDYS